MKTHCVNYGILSLLLTAALTLCSCSRSDADELVGKWQLEDVDEAKGTSIVCTYVFNQDGTFTGDVRMKSRAQGVIMGMTMAFGGTYSVEVGNVLKLKTESDKNSFTMDDVEYENTSLSQEEQEAMNNFMVPLLQGVFTEAAKSISEMSYLNYKIKGDELTMTEDGEDKQPLKLKRVTE